MQFLFSILVTCAVFVNGYHNKRLVPLVSEKNSFIENESFIELAKNDPKELIEQMKKADPQKVQEVIVLLEAMVASSEEQMSQLVNDITQAEEELLNKHRDYSNKKQISDDAAEAKALAQGKLSEATVDVETQVPALEQEIQSLTDILNLLDSLNQNRRRTLLNIKEQKIHELLGVMENADPQKVSEIRTLVDGLIENSQSQIDNLKSRMSEAGVELTTLTSAAAIAAGELTDAQTAKDIAQGILDEAKRRHDTNVQKLEAEVQTLNDVITLLKTINE